MQALSLMDRTIFRENDGGLYILTPCRTGLQLATTKYVFCTNTHSRAHRAFSLVVILALANTKNWILATSQASNNFIHYPGAWILSNLFYPLAKWKNSILSNYPSQNWILSFYLEKALCTTRNVEFTESRYLQNMHRYGFPNNQFLLYYISAFRVYTKAGFGHIPLPRIFNISGGVGST